MTNESSKPSLAVPAWLRGATVPVLSIVVALVIAGAILVLTGADPIRVYSALIEGAFLRPDALFDTLIKMAPYLLLGMAVSLSFMGGLFNVGAEGQFFVGALASTYIGYSLKGLPIFIHLPLALTAGFAAGALWAAIAGLLKAYRGAHEVITTIMLNYIAYSLSDWLINGPMRGAGTAPQSPPILASAKLPHLFGIDNPIHLGLPLALGLVLIFGWLIRRSPIGLRIRMVGANQNAARYAGIDIKRTMILTMMLSGGLAGLAGSTEILGSFGAMPSVFTTGYGFDGIAIALLGQGTPLGVFLSSLLFAAFNSGSGYMQLSSNVQATIIDVIKALILIFVGAPAIIGGLLPKSFSEPAAEAVLPKPSAMHGRNNTALVRVLVSVALGYVAIVMFCALAYLAYTIGSGILSAAGKGVTGGNANWMRDVINLNWSSILGSTFNSATPIVLAALGGILSERSGVTNIALDGIMVTGAFTAFAVALVTKSAVMGLVFAAVGGMLIASLHAVLSIAYRTDQVISGTVINILAAGITGYLYRQLATMKIIDINASITTLPQIAIPILSNLPIVGVALFQQQPIVYGSLVLVFVLSILLARTAWGLRMRAVGEYPRAAATAGVNVNGVRYLNVILSGLLAGIGGAWFVVEAVGTFNPGIVGGKGFIGLTTMIFGNWSPVGAFLASLLFTVPGAIQSRLQLIGLDFIPYQFFTALPNLFTIIVLGGFALRNRPPAAIGKPYP